MFLRNYGMFLITAEFAQSLLIYSQNMMRCSEQIPQSSKLMTLSSQKRP
jgi:hypothetical protein